MKPECPLPCWQQPITCLSHKPHKCTPHPPSDSLLFTSTSFTFSHLRLSFRNCSVQVPSPQTCINLFHPQYVPNIPPLYSFIPSATKTTNPFIVRLSLAPRYFHPLMLLTMVVTINVALPSGARIRNRSHICTSIIPMIPTRGENTHFTDEKICLPEASI
jgi:hypothetical protein